MSTDRRDHLEHPRHQHLRRDDRHPVHVLPVFAWALEFRWQIVAGGAGSGGSPRRTPRCCSRPPASCAPQCSVRDAQSRQLFAQKVWTARAETETNTRKTPTKGNTQRYIESGVRAYTSAYDGAPAAPTCVPSRRVPRVPPHQPWAPAGSEGGLSSSERSKASAIMSAQAPSRISDAAT